QSMAPHTQKNFRGVFQMTLSRPLAVSLIAAATLVLTACDRSDAAASKHAAPDAASAASAPSTVLLIAPEDMRVVGLQAHAGGPVITGTVQPGRRADLRAEVSAVVMQVYKENGEPVHKGDLLVRLDATAISDALRSAEEASRAAKQALDQAQRSY